MFFDMSIIQPILRGGRERIVNGTEKRIYAQRVLTPTEYGLIWQGAEEYTNQLKLDLCLLTAGRYSELRALQYNKQWFEPAHNAIHVKEYKKERLKRGVRDRYIHLSRKGVDIVRAFLNTPNIHLSNYSAMEKNLRRWAERVDVSTEGLSIKCMRKTYESWLITYYPEKTLSILQSTGHTQAVSMEHYANLPFTQGDRQLMAVYVEGWV